MKRLKLSFAAVALIATAGATVAAHANSVKSDSNNCSSVKGGPLDRDSNDCVGPSPTCCYVGNTIITGEYE